MIIKKQIVYAGIDGPKTEKELRVEILGLKNAIRQSEELISRYEQVLAIKDLSEEIFNARSSLNADKNSEGTTRGSGVGSEGEEG